MFVYIKILQNKRFSHPSRRITHTYTHCEEIATLNTPESNRLTFLIESISGGDKNIKLWPFTRDDHVRTSQQLSKNALCWCGCQEVHGPSLLLMWFLFVFAFFCEKVFSAFTETYTHTNTHIHTYINTSFSRKTRDRGGCRTICARTQPRQETNSEKHTDRLLTPKSNDKLNSITSTQNLYDIELFRARDVVVRRYRPHRTGRFCA